MDDTGLGESIGCESAKVDDHDALPGLTTTRTNLHLNPTRWWFASAGFPMIAGTLGPVASAFSICALVEKWRQVIPPGHNVLEAQFIDDPPWLTAINAVQLALAVVANVALLLNMTMRLRFSVAMPITIVGWFISAMILVALLVAAECTLVIQVDGRLIWSKAFYFGIFAAILYFIVASLMVVTVWGAQMGHYRKEFQLSPSQRTLMLQTIVFLGYLLVGALVFSTVEDWRYLDGVYWAIVTLFTVGFGDISPKTPVGRGLLIPYALVGVTSLGLVIGSIRSLVLDRGKLRLEARMLEKKRRKLLHDLEKKGKQVLLEPMAEPLATVDGEAARTFPELKGKQLPRTEFERRQKEFNYMRKIQKQTSTRRAWTSMAISTTIWLMLWLIGAAVFQQCELPYQPWTYANAAYFAFEGLTTIGYGDITPISNPGRAFWVVWALLALPATTVLISNAGDTVVKFIRDGTILLGNLTILPGDAGFDEDIKHVVRLLTFGKVFGEGNAEDLSTMLDRYRQKEKARAAQEGDGGFKKQEDEEKGQSQTRGSTADHLSTPSERKLTPEDLPTDKNELHMVLIEEIERVTQDLSQSPSRKYTFEEWSWFLRLLGEDESNHETHRKPLRIPPHDRQKIAMSSEDQEEAAQMEKKVADPWVLANKPRTGLPLKWSWVGHQSPLMDQDLDEPRWVLDRLEQRLKRELYAELKESQKRRHDVSQEREMDIISQREEQGQSSES